MAIFDVVYQYSIVPIENIYVNGEEYLDWYDDDMEIESYCFTWCKDPDKTRLEIFTKE